MEARSTAADGVASLCGVTAAAAASRAACSAAETEALVWIAQSAESSAAKKQRKNRGATKANSMLAWPSHGVMLRTPPHLPMVGSEQGWRGAPV